MQKQFTEDELKQCNLLDALLFKCIVCHNAFDREKHEYLKSIELNQASRLLFCTAKCELAYNNHTEPHKCRQCDNTFLRRKAEVNRSKYGFCCSGCASKYNYDHGKCGLTRSKLEEWIEDQFLLEFPDLTVHYNDRSILKKSELDIYIPSLDLAFEINGPVHYDPIFGDKQLRSVQRNDRRKINKCADAGIEIISVDTREMHAFNETKAVRYFNQLKTHVNRKKESIRRNETKSFGLQD